jgi:hypothetical protein
MLQILIDIGVDSTSHFDTKLLKKPQGSVNCLIWKIKISFFIKKMTSIVFLVQILD